MRDQNEVWALNISATRFREPSTFWNLNQNLACLYLFANKVKGFCFQTEEKELLYKLVQRFTWHFENVPILKPSGFYGPPFYPLRSRNPNCGSRNGGLKTRSCDLKSRSIQGIYRELKCWQCLVKMNQVIWKHGKVQALVVK